MSSDGGASGRVDGGGGTGDGGDRHGNFDIQGMGCRHVQNENTSCLIHSVLPTKKIAVPSTAIGSFLNIKCYYLSYQLVSLP